MRPVTLQQQARARNWNIFRLRALYVQCGQLLDGDLRLAAQAIVDEQLVRKGAEAEGVRRARHDEVMVYAEGGTRA